MRTPIPVLLAYVAIGFGLEFDLPAAFELPAEVHLVRVGGGDHQFTPRQVFAEIGDVIRFIFQDNSTLTSSSLANPCQPSGNFNTEFSIFDSGVNHTDLLVTTTAPQWFFSRKESEALHCAPNMLFAINPLDLWDNFKQNAGKSSSLVNSTPCRDTPNPTTHDPLVQPPRPTASPSAIRVGSQFSARSTNAPLIPRPSLPAVVVVKTTVISTTLLPKRSCASASQYDLPRASPSPSRSGINPRVTVSSTRPQSIASRYDSGIAVATSSPSATNPTTILPVAVSSGVELRVPHFIMLTVISFCSFMF